MKHFWYETPQVLLVNVIFNIKVLVDFWVSSLLLGNIDGFCWYFCSYYFFRKEVALQRQKLPSVFHFSHSLSIPIAWSFSHCLLSSVSVLLLKGSHNQSFFSTQGLGGWKHYCIQPPEYAEPEGLSRLQLVAGTVTCVLSAEALVDEGIYICMCVYIDIYISLYIYTHTLFFFRTLRWCFFLYYRTTKLMKTLHYSSRLRQREDLWGQTGRYWERTLQPYESFISRKKKFTVPWRLAVCVLKQGAGIEYLFIIIVK